MGHCICAQVRLVDPRCLAMFSLGGFRGPYSAFVFSPVASIVVLLIHDLGGRKDETVWLKNVTVMVKGENGTQF